MKGPTTKMKYIKLKKKKFGPGLAPWPPPGSNPYIYIGISASNIVLSFSFWVYSKINNKNRRRRRRKKTSGLDPKFVMSYITFYLKPVCFFNNFDPFDLKFHSEGILSLLCRFATLLVLAKQWSSTRWRPCRLARCRSVWVFPFFFFFFFFN